MNASVLCTIIVDETVYKVPKCGERYFLVAKNKHTYPAEPHGGQEEKELKKYLEKK
jgi:hypothetical protein